MDFVGGKKLSKKNILNVLNGKSNDFVTKFFTKPAVVISLYRNLSVTCREIINRCLSTNPEKLYELDSENNISHIEQAKLKLTDYHIISVIDSKLILNSVFKQILVLSMSKGIKQFFKIEQDTRKTQLNSNAVLDFEKFMEIYNFILEKEIQVHKHENYISTLNQTFKEVLNKLNFQIRIVNSNQDKNISGFKFLVEPINQQINIILLHYYEFLIQNKLKLFKKIDSDSNFEQNLLEIFCTLNFLSCKYDYSFNSFENYIRTDVVAKVVEDLASIGLLEINKSSQSFRISELLENFLNNNNRVFEQFKTNIIVETDFKMYVYSEFEYVEHFLGCLSRSVYQN